MDEQNEAPKNKLDLIITVIVILAIVVVAIFYFKGESRHSQTISVIKN
jgi:hypothetical protein